MNAGRLVANSPSRNVWHVNDAKVRCVVRRFAAVSATRIDQGCGAMATAVVVAQTMDFRGNLSLGATYACPIRGSLLESGETLPLRCQS